MDYERHFYNPPMTCRQCGRRFIVECGYSEQEARTNEFNAECPVGHFVGRVVLRGEEITDISNAK